MLDLVTSRGAKIPIYIRKASIKVSLSAVNNQKSFVNIYRRSREVLINEDADGQIVEVCHNYLILHGYNWPLIRFLSICLCGGAYDRLIGLLVVYILPIRPLSSPIQLSNPDPSFI